mmetsp:Transcript_6916/g.21075  ORF Transcript_6916/g.21075 Transcript_6916/m.21075 type:complete len:93 (-) Transcript_6916:1081-1359(-)
MLCCVQCSAAPFPSLSPGPGSAFDNGRLDVSTHPFTGGAGPTDVRITTRFSENWIEGFGATVHECGHALYEQVRETEYMAREADACIRPRAK